MAKVETLDVSGGKMEILNVSQPVGPFRGELDDVIAVKGLLFIALGDLGVDESRLVRPFAGTLDEMTKANIKLFQQKINELNKSIRNPERLTVDGRISRARGRFSFDRNRPWTIAVLNVHVKLAAERRGFSSMMRFLTSIFPDFSDFIPR